MKAKNFNMDQVQIDKFKLNNMHRGGRVLFLAVACFLYLWPKYMAFSLGLHVNPYNFTLIIAILYISLKWVKGAFGFALVSGVTGAF